MTEKQDWFDKVRASAALAEFVFNDEIDRLTKNWEKMVAKDKREGKRVKREVEVDALFAKHHLQYLIKVVDREASHLDALLVKLHKANEDGNDKKVDRLSKKISKQILESDAHIEKVTERVAEHLERDAKAAAKHLVKGLKRMGLNAEEFAEELNGASARVAEVIQKVIENEEDGEDTTGVVEEVSVEEVE